MVRIKKSIRFNGEHPTVVSHAISEGVSPGNGGRIRLMNKEQQKETLMSSFPSLDGLTLLQDDYSTSDEEDQDNDGGDTRLDVDRNMDDAKRRKTVPPGLCNKGNMCFLNSTLQALASVPSFIANLNESGRRIRNLKRRRRPHRPISDALCSLLRSLNGETPVDQTVASLKQSLSADTVSPVKAIDPSPLADLIRKHQVLAQAMASSGSWERSSILGSAGVLQEQQDAQEMLQTLIQALTDEFSGADPRSSKTPTLKDLLQPASSLQTPKIGGLASVLGGWFGTSIECTKCGFKRPIANSPFLTMTLSLTDLPQCAVSLESCISALTATEYLREVECSQCTIKEQTSHLGESIQFLEDSLKDDRILQDAVEAKELSEELASKQRAYKVLTEPRPYRNCFCGGNCASEEDCEVTPVRSSISKRLLISRLPSVLILHVNRQEFCPNSGLPMKSRKRVLFGLELDMAPFCAFGGQDWRSVGSNHVSKGDQSPSRKSAPIMYDLCAVIEHHGGAVGGHYSTYRRVKLDKSVALGSTCSEASSNSGEDLVESWVHASDLDVQVVPFQRVLQCEAYLLFYERRNSDI